MRTIFASLLALTACGGGPAESLDEADEAIVSSDATARISALGANEIVVSIDEMPNFGKEKALAESLKNKGVTAVVFAVGERIGTVDPKSGSRYGQNVTVLHGLEHVLASGHLVANHTYSHPIGGAPKSPFNPRGCSYAQMATDARCGEMQAARELVWTQQLLIAAVNRAGAQYGPQLRRWFRPSGGSWDASTARHITAQLDELARGDRNFSGFEAPIGWHVPVASRCAAGPLVRGGVIDRELAGCRAREGSLVDWQCHDLYKVDRTFMPPEACADSYLRGVAAAGNKGVVLFHGNLDTDDYSRKTIESFVTKVRAAGRRVVHPDCAVPATRAAARCS
jgi:peptidoglycan/xylan/chitin deacetylase (PgdA/CDA1 family)